MNPKFPLFKDVGIISLIPDIWGHPWQPRQQVTTRMARYFNVVWFEEAKGWRDLWFHRNQIRETITEKNTLRDLTNFTVYRSEKFLPKFYRPKLLGSITEKTRLRRAIRILKKQGSEKIILYLWRPEYGYSLDAIKYHLSCYHVDDEYTFSEKELPNSEDEIRVLKKVDQVIIHSKTLLEKKGSFNPNTILVPNGVNYKAYSNPTDEPADMREIPNPRIGYIGMIKRDLNFSLVSELAERYKGWSFVFVGPLQQMNMNESDPALNKLKNSHNVYFLGGKEVETLPAYTQHMDVLMLCYLENDWTKFIYPLKLHEYLASGRPIVGTPIHSLLEFKDVIELGRTTEEWEQSIEKLLHPSASSEMQIHLRRSVAIQYDWDKLVYRIVYAICKKIGNRYIEALEEIKQYEC